MAVSEPNPHPCVTFSKTNDTECSDREAVTKESKKNAEATLEEAKKKKEGAKTAKVCI